MGCNNNKLGVNAYSPHSPVTLDEKFLLTTPNNDTTQLDSSKHRKPLILDQNIFAREARQEKASSFIIIWLDAKVSKTEENVQFQSELRQLSDQVKVYDSATECEIEIRRQVSSAQENIYLIVSGSLGKVFVPKVHNLAQIAGIFVFCSNVIINEEWSKNYIKVKGIHDQLQSLKTSIRNELSILSNVNDSSPMEIISNALQGQSHSLGSTDILAVHIYLEILLRIEEPSSRENMLETLREHYNDNPQQLAFIEEFNNEYTPKKAVWWYTRETCFYRFLNQQLRLQNIDLVQSCFYFVSDLYKQLKIEHEKFVKLRKVDNRVLHVYRGQVISKQEVKKIEQNIGRFITMNSFLSTSPFRETAEIFLTSTAVTSWDLIPVIFEIEIDTQVKNTKPYADITHLSDFPDEQEILIMLGALFKIHQVNQSDGEVATVKLSLCDEDENELKDMMERVKEITDEPDIILKGIIIDSCEESQQYFENLLNTLPPDHPNVSACYCQLARIAENLDDYDQSIALYDKAIVSCLRIAPDDSIRLSRYYEHLVQAYLDNDNYQMCIRTSEQLHDIQMKYLPEVHYLVADNYYRIGTAFHRSGDYDSGLTYFQKALDIRLKTLSQNHRDIAECYNNIGAAHHSKRDYVPAIEHYNKSLDIYRNCVPPDEDGLHETEGFLQRAYDDQLTQQQQQQQSPQDVQ